MKALGGGTGTRRGRAAKGGGGHVDRLEADAASGRARHAGLGPLSAQPGGVERRGGGRRGGGGGEGSGEGEVFGVGKGKGRRASM